MDGASLNITKDLIQKLKEIIPQAFTEDKIDIARLQTILGDAVTTEIDSYGLSWVGKNEAYKVLQTPTTATLIPNPEHSVDWNNAENIFIEGENLEVLKVLQKSYYGKVKMIYIDPPYNTGNDSFIYPDKFSETKEEYLKRIGDKDDDGFMTKTGLFRKNNKENGHYHSNWLSMMLPRLFLARNLLKDDGVIFVSIDDNEQANLKLLMDDVFGEENFIGNFIWHSRQNVDSRSLNGASIDHEYVICYSKNNNSRIRGKEIDKNKYTNPDNDERGAWMSSPMDGIATKDQRPNLHYTIVNPETNISYNPSAENGWRFQKSTVDKLIEEKRIIWPKNDNSKPRFKRYLNELNNEFTGFSSILKVDFTSAGTKQLRELFGIETIKFPKPTSLIKEVVKQGTNKNDLILDFFAGSGTTAQAVMELNEEDGGNRKYICVQLPEELEKEKDSYKAGYKTIADISKARIEKVIDKIKRERNGKIELEKHQNLGFRKYTLASSNFKIWRGDVVENEEDLIKQMELFTTPQKEGKESENILWELLIKNGVSLTEKIECITLQDGAKIYHTANKKLAFVIDSYTNEVQTAVLTLKPKNIICLDSLFENNDNLKTNAQLKFEDNGISFKTI